MAEELRPLVRVVSPLCGIDCHVVIIAIIVIIVIIVIIATPRGELLRLQHFKY